MIKGGLKLKREVATSPVVKPIGEFPVAEVWVDTSVFHLDEPYSYLVPGNLNQIITVGSLVSVPFNGREVTGVVIGRHAGSTQGALKSINKCLGSYPILSEEIIELIRVASKRYACNPFDLIRSALPDRVVTVERELSSVLESHTPEVSTTPSSKFFQSKSNRLFLQLPPFRDRSELMAQRVSLLNRTGGVLVILPDSREVERLSQSLDRAGLSHSKLDSSLPKSEQYRNFLSIRLGLSNIAIGTRSAIFAPVDNLKTIVIYNEGSEHLYERRSPGWNVRDLALLRSRLSPVDLLFVGYSPSSEIARLMEEDWVSYKPVKTRLKVSVYSQQFGELLPSRAVAPIRNALKSGPVLFIVPLKGYAQAIRCAQCKTISRCQCGGALEKKSNAAPISCHHCQSIFQQWKCSWCHHEVPSLISRGVERHQQEIAALFPSVPTWISTGDKPISSIPGNSFEQDGRSSGIVLATPGMAPYVETGYSAVVILEGNRFLNQPDLRSQERVRELFFAHAALLQENGTLLLIQDDGYSISTALTAWNPRIPLQGELQERRELNLPPYVRLVTLTMDSSEITRLKSALLSARDEAKLPESMKILGPVLDGDNSTLILTVDISKGDEFVATIHEFMRRRSAGKKKLPSLRIDPYSLAN